MSLSRKLVILWCTTIIVFSITSCQSATYTRLIHLKKNEFKSCAHFRQSPDSPLLIFDKNLFIHFLNTNGLSDSTSISSESNVDTLDIRTYWQNETLIVQEFIEANLSSGLFKSPELQGKFVKRQKRFIRSIKTYVTFKMRGTEIFQRRYAHVHF